MRKKVLVIAHDAGGAEIIGAYIKKHNHAASYRCYVAGPARSIFKRLQIRFHHIDEHRGRIRRIIERHRDVHMALLGAPSELMTTIELCALLEAKKAGIKTVVYLEWWKDYRGMFGYPRRGWEKKLPDVLWAGDRHALSLAKKQFPHVPIRFVKNQYFADVQKRYAHEQTNFKLKGILFMSSLVKGMERILAAILLELHTYETTSMHIRLHPSDNRHRYDSVIRTYRGVTRVAISREADIVRDLARSRLVLGTETVALAVAALCKLPTVNVLPSTMKSSLPFRGIVQMRVRDRLPVTLKRMIRIAAHNA